jgi:ABC-type amino acid transport system permease subunit
MEAAAALGMTRGQAVRRYSAAGVRIVIPPVTNDFIALFKDTSVCSVITVWIDQAVFDPRGFDQRDHRLAVTAVLYF